MITGDGNIVTGSMIVFHFPVRRPKVVDMPKLLETGSMSPDHARIYERSVTHDRQVEFHVLEGLCGAPGFLLQHVFTQNMLRVDCFECKVLMDLEMERGNFDVKMDTGVPLGYLLGPQSKMSDKLSADKCVTQE